MRTADGPTSKLPHPQKTPIHGLPPRWKIRDFPPGATARFIGQGEPETNQIDLFEEKDRSPEIRLVWTVALPPITWAQTFSLNCQKFGRFEPENRPF